MRQVKVTNKRCWSEAQRYLVGGVNSPVRSFQAVGGAPFFVDRGNGAYLWDVEGKRYLDFVGSWGALILGHRHPAVLKAVREALERGTRSGIMVLAGSAFSTSGESPLQAESTTPRKTIIITFIAIT